MKVITTNRLNRFWKNGILPKIAEKLASSAVINNLTTTAAGYALDARQGKTLKDEIDRTNTGLSTLNADLSTISNALNVAGAYQIQAYSETATYGGKSYNGITLGVVRRADAKYAVLFFQSFDGVLLTRSKNNGTFTEWVRAN